MTSKKPDDNGTSSRIWVCDDPHCGYKGYDQTDADNHCISTNHSVTRCKILK